MTFEGPWPHPEMWWCVCPHHDCSAFLYGPYATAEGAQDEVEGSRCEEKHFAIKGEPPLTHNVRCYQGCGYDPVSTRNDACDYLDWRHAMIGDPPAEPHASQEFERARHAEKHWAALTF